MTSAPVSSTFPQPAHRRWRILAAFAIVGSILAAYSTVLPGAFIWDDQQTIRYNPLLQNPGGLAALWTTIGGIPADSHWWPLTYTVFWLEHALFGWQPAYFHLVNMLLHAAVSLQLARIVLRLGRSLSPRRAGVSAFLAAALFALHPIHAESVAWISDLKDLLAAGLGLLAVEGFLRYEDDRRPDWQFCIVLALSGAMLAKSSAMAIPVGMALLAWWRRGRPNSRDAASLAPAFLVVIAFAVIDWRTHSIMNVATAQAPPILMRLALAGRTLLFYAGKFLWPLNLSAIYPQFHIDASRPSAWAPLAAEAGLTFVLWVARARIGRGPLACWLFYVVALGPVLGLLHFNFLDVSPAADRYQYLGSLAPIAGAGWILGGAVERAGSGLRRVLAAALALAFALLGLQTARSAANYESQTALFANAARIAPESSQAFNNLASGLYHEGRINEAVAALETCLRLDPERTLRDGDLAYLLMTLGRDAESAALYRKGLALDPNDYEMKDALAWVLATSSDPAVRNPKEALALAREVDRLSPNADAKRLDTLAAAQAAAGDFAGATSNAQLGLRIAAQNGQSEFGRDLELRLRLYSAGRAFQRAAPMPKQ